MAGSWLKPFWDYLDLKYRVSLPTGVHFNILLENNEYKYRYTKSELAGKISYFVAELYHAIIDEKVAPAKIRRSEERRVGKSGDLAGRRMIKKKKTKRKKEKSV